MLNFSAMLDSKRGGFRRALFTLGVLFTAALAVSTSGCLAVFGGLQSTNVDFLVVPHNGAFWGWTEITVGVDISSVNKATLVSVTMDVEKPVGTPDLSFLSTLKGEAVTPTARTTLVTLDRFPKGEQAVIMNVVYAGDLHPLFKDSQTIRIEWTGATNQAFTGWPPGNAGFWVRGAVQINLE